GFHSATVWVTVIGLPPDAVDDPAAITEDSTGNVIDVLGNDSDPDGDPLTLVNVTAPAHGAAWIAGNQLYYTPTPNYPNALPTGPDTFQYTIDDGDPGTGTDTATVTITVTNVPDPPIALDNQYEVVQNTGLIVPAPGVLGNDTDADEDPLTAAVVVLPTNGSVAMGLDGSFSYTPHTDFLGLDTFTYRAADGTGRTDEATVTINVHIEPAWTLSIQAPLGSGVTAPGTGDHDVRVGESALVTANADPGWTFICWLGNAVPSGQAQSNPLTVPAGAEGQVKTLRAVFVNTAPQFFDGHYYQLVHVPAGIQWIPARDAAASMTHLGLPGHLVTITSQAENDYLAANFIPPGEINSVLSSRVWTGGYQPPGSPEPAGNWTWVTGEPWGFTSWRSGEPSNSGDTHDEDVAVFVTTWGDEWNDTDGDYGAANHYIVEYDAIGLAPVAVDDSYHTTPGPPLNVPAPGVLANDSDPNGDALTAVPASGGAHGLVSLATDGSFTYTPDPGFEGIDTFTYKAYDGAHESNVATVIIVVGTTEQGLIAHWKMDAGQGVTAYDYSGNGNHGTLVNGPTWATGIDGGALDFDGQNDYVDCGSSPSLNSMTTRMTVSAFIRTTGGGAVLGKRNDYDTADDFVCDIEGTFDKVRFSAGEGATFGRAETTQFPDVNDGEWRHVVWLLDTTQTDGSDRIRLYVDGVRATILPVYGAPALDAAMSLSSAIHVAIGARRINVGGEYFFDGLIDDVRIYDRALSLAEIRDMLPPLPPVAVDDNYRTTLGSALVVDAVRGVLANDSDPQGDPITAAPETLPTDGILALAADGSFTYTPAPGFEGTDTFTYRVNDGALDSDPATVTLIVVGDVTDGLIAHWKFDERAGATAFDSTANHNDGATHGAQWDNGVWGSALRFDGDDDYVDCGSTPSLNSMTTQMTICTWIKTTADGVTILGKRNDLPTEDIHCAIGAGSRLAFSADMSNIGKFEATPPPNVQDGEWHHIVWRYDSMASDANERLAMYVDGVRLTNPVTYQPPDLYEALLLRPSVNVIIGSIDINIGGRNFFDGLIDDVRIYDRALTGDEILAVANIPRPLFVDVGGNQFPDPVGHLGDTFFDVDNDGDQDLGMTTAGFNGHHLYINDGTGSFTAAPNHGGLRSNGEGHSFIPGDYDNDGHMDVAIGWYWAGGSELYHNDGDGTFTNVSSSSGVGNPGQAHAGAFADVDGDGDLDLSLARNGANRLYINDGAGHFSEQGGARGVAMGDYGISTMLFDADHDGDLDLLATSSTSLLTNKLLINDGTGHFTDGTAAAGLSGVGHEAAALGDLDNDGDLDIFCGQDGMFLNDGAGHFTDISATCGVTAGNVLSLAWADVDNDGDLDLISGGTLWLNNGDRTFTDGTAYSGIDPVGANPSSITLADMDGDGDLDLRPSTRALLRNQTDNDHYLIVKPVHQSGSPALNAKVWVYRAGHVGEAGHLLGYREMYGATTRVSGSPLYAHFGVPNDGAVDLRVHFLSGRIVELPGTSRGQTLTVVEPGPPVPGILYVDEHALGANDGTSWIDAYVDLQDALAAAIPGDQIWVADGDYKPTDTGDRTVSFVIPAGVAVYGGFASGETALGQRDWDVNVATLSGDIGVEGTADDNSRHVVDMLGGRLDGVRVANGGDFASQGGGIHAVDTDIRIRYCTVVDCRANDGGGIYVRDCTGAIEYSTVRNCHVNGWGGGICAWRFTGRIAFNVIEGNSVQEEGEGGGLFYESDGGELKGNIICGNVGSSVGGGVHLRHGSFRLADNLFVGNQAANGGGLGVLQSTLVTCVGDSFVDNRSVYQGGGVFIFTSGVGTPNTQAVLLNCILWGNESPSGGQMKQLLGSEVSVSYCDVQGGQAGVVVGSGSTLLWGTGNLDAPPLFAAPGHWEDGGWPRPNLEFDTWVPGDYHLQAGSPCIGVGDNSVVQAGETDMDGEPRIQQGVVDMGADETALGGPVVLPVGVQVDMMVMNGAALNINAPACRSLGIMGIDPGANPPDTLYALRVGSDPGAGWLQHRDTLGRTDAFPDGTAPEWHTAAEWVLRLRGLEPDTDYAFTSHARSAGGIETIGVALETY
ncbi:tandem-95 repeat protein, partial [bacterium]|nr:tandem-95 repeat protein [bacterium]